MHDEKNKECHLGLVKWFGGYNHHKEKENDFGFIQTMDGKDIFIHEKEIKNGSSLNENELVVFETGEKNGKQFARKLFRVNGDINDKGSVDVFQLYIKNMSKFNSFFSSYAFKSSLKNFLNNNLNESNVDFLNVVKNEEIHNLHLYELIKTTSNWEKIFVAIYNGKTFNDLFNIGIYIDNIPPGYIKEHECELYKHIEGLSEEEIYDFFESNIKILPTTLVLVGVINKILIDEKLIFHRYSDINCIIENKFRETDNNLPEYVNEAFSSSFKGNINDYLSNPTIWKILEPLLLKKRLYSKNPNTCGFFNNSKHLKSNIEYFILANLLPLIQANNDLDVAYKILLHRLWESLSDEVVDIKDKGLFNLFPSCSTMRRHQLSCEAVYWPKNKKYLCRGQECVNPEVNPNSKKHYLDYNIYDWFQHYGINYIDENAPSKRDFPIKLAGYFNRLKEIFKVLHCRECGNLMKPDMRYARVEYIDYESGVPVTKSMAAAYRATVFECGSHSCHEYEKKYYINHCLDFSCYSIIDSRDLKIKCDDERYICKGCGGCCGQHAKDNPIGLCSNCGSKLNLYEDESKTDRYGKNERHVSCSNRKCNFEIIENLPKKFYLPSCSPVIKINKNSTRF